MVHAVGLLPDPDELEGKVGKTAEDPDKEHELRDEQPHNSPRDSSAGTHHHPAFLVLGGEPAKEEEK